MHTSLLINMFWVVSWIYLAIKFLALMNQSHMVNYMNNLAAIPVCPEAMLNDYVTR